MDVGIVKSSEGGKPQYAVQIVTPIDGTSTMPASKIVCKTDKVARTNWSGAAMATFYTAVRQALVVAIIFRGLATVGGLAGVTWWFLRYWGGSGSAAGVGEL